MEIADDLGSGVPSRSQPAHNDNIHVVFALTRGDL